ncbi:MAG: rhodanese-like domain-containing protein [Steroidobacteraceae bacterium]
MNLRLLTLATLLLAPAFAQAQDSFGGGKPAQQTKPVAPAADARRPAPPNPPPARSTDPERQDLGVPATSQLHTGAMHGPTPSTIPGGQVITTVGLQDLVAKRQTPFLLLDILGGPQIIPGAQFAVPAAQAGSFNDATQQQFGQYLQQATRGNKEYPLVLYCQSRECWMSYNAALRAINLGYTNVLWYRGGIEAWQAAGQPVQQAGGGAPQR